MFERSLLLADFKIIVRSEYGYTVNLCSRYQLPAPLTPEEADLIVSVTEEEVAAELLVSANKNPGYVESICIYRNICRRLPALGGFLFHAAVITDGEHGYAFTADSGTGKTTHITLWQKAFGDSVKIVNGDKPLLRKREGKWYAYGTPWCGKEGWNINTSVPLDAICVLRRGETNAIRPYPAAEALPELMPQLLLPEDPAGLMATLDFLDQLLTEVPLFELHCTISEEAARVARAAMIPDGE